MEELKFLLHSGYFYESTVEKIFEAYFNGQKNIITPIVVQYDALLAPTRICLFEISTNNKKKYFGITTLCYNRLDGSIQRIDLNKLVDTLDDANKYISRITLGEIEKGDLYGKKI